jgi:TetR/AcrR family transcriptional repressor of nem operon
MARPKSFDEDEVLDAAIDCFRRHGLKSASIRDLADEMGIAGPSLYNAYGCKRELFAKALERYANVRTRARLAGLEQDNPPRQAILAFFSETIETSLSDPGGCLIVNTAMEATPQDAALCKTVAGYLSEIHAFFRRNLQAGQADGSIPDRIDSGDMAQMLMALLLGLSVIARTRPDRDLLMASVRPVFQLLTTPPTPANED